MRKKTTSWYPSSSLLYWVLITFLAGLCLMTHSPFSTTSATGLLSVHSVGIMGPHVDNEWWGFYLKQLSECWHTSESLWVDIHPFQCVVIFFFKNQFDFIGAVSLGAGQTERTVTTTSGNEGSIVPPESESNIYSIYFLLFHSNYSLFISLPQSVLLYHVIPLLDKFILHLLNG